MIQLADNELEQIDFLMQQTDDMLFDCADRAQIINLHIVGLAQPVNTADSLLDPHRIPWEIEIDHMMAELQG